MVSIERIQNRFLWDRFVNHKRQLRTKLGKESDVKQLWHGCGNTDSSQISDGEQGFDNRYSEDGMYGYGNYFAIHANYSVSGSYCKDEGNNTKGLFLAKLLIGVTFVDSNQQMRGQKKPPQKPDVKMYDSVTGNQQMYIVYDNEKSYPAYYLKF